MALKYYPTFTMHWRKVAMRRRLWKLLFNIDMIDITYLDGAKQERVMHFDSYDEFERSQQACLIGVADFYPVVKLTYNGHELDYQGTYGDVFFYLMKQDLTQYQN